VTNPPADTPQSIYEVKVEGNNILVKKQGKRKASSQIERQEMNSYVNQ
jgi:ribosomal protein L23